MRTLKEIIKDHIEYRRQLVQLAKADMKKAYGGVAYAENMSACFRNAYVLVPFEEGIRRTISHE